MKTCTSRFVVYDERGKELISSVPLESIGRIVLSKNGHYGGAYCWTYQASMWIFFDVDPERRIVDVSSVERRTTTTYRKR